MIEEMELVGEDSELFLNALSNPPEPNNAMRLAAERYKISLLLETLRREADRYKGYAR